MKTSTDRQQQPTRRAFLGGVAAMAACALVSVASGSVSFRHRVHVDRLMDTLDALRVFDPHEGVELFNQFVDALKADPEAGHRHALEVIADEVAHEVPELLEVRDAMRARPRQQGSLHLFVGRLRRLSQGSGRHARAGNARG